MYRLNKYDRELNSGEQEKTNSYDPDKNGDELRETPSDKEKVILVITADEKLRSFLNRLLAARYTIENRKNTNDWNYVEKSPHMVIIGASDQTSSEIELIRHLKGNASTGHIHLIWLTNDDETLLLDGYNAGADLCFTLPPNEDLLVIVVRNLFDRYERMSNPNKTAPLTKTPHIDKAASSDFLVDITRCIENNMEVPIGVPELSLEMGLSRSTLYRKWNSLDMIELRDYIRQIKLNRAKVLLTESDLSIQEIAFKVGFSDRKYFSRVFRGVFGKSPRSIRSDRE